jgi:hypothetical protein
VTLRIQQAGRFLTQLMARRFHQLRQQLLTAGQQLQLFAQLVRLNPVAQVMDFKLHPGLRLELQQRRLQLHCQALESVMVTRLSLIRGELGYSIFSITERHRTQTLTVT